MRVQATETKLYTFDELSESAKERARDWYREGNAEDTYWSESVIDDAATIAALLGIDLSTRTVRLMDNTTRQEPQIFWSGFSSQGDGASFHGRWRYSKGMRRAIRAHVGTSKLDLELIRIADVLAKISRKYFYRACIDVSSNDSRYSHEMTMRFEDVGEPEMSADDFDTVSEALRDFARWIYRSLEQECDYVNSAEQVDESIRANEYEFTEEGKRA